MRVRTSPRLRSQSWIDWIARSIDMVAPLELQGEVELLAGDGLASAQGSNVEPQRLLTGALSRSANASDPERAHDELAGGEEDSSDGFPLESRLDLDRLGEVVERARDAAAR